MIKRDQLKAKVIVQSSACGSHGSQSMNVNVDCGQPNVQSHGKMGTIVVTLLALQRFPEIREF